MKRFGPALLLVLLFSAVPVFMSARAQDGGNPPIPYNDPTIVTLTPGQSVTRTFSVQAGDNIEVRLSPLANFTYTAALLDPAGQSTPLTPGADGNTIFPVTSAPLAGPYSIVLQASDPGGDILVLISGTAVPPVDLAVGETIVDLQTSELRYRLLPPIDLVGPMLLSVNVVPPDPNDTNFQGLLPALILTQTRSGETAADVGADLLVNFSATLPSQTEYILAIQPGAGPMRLRINWDLAPLANQPGLAGTGTCQVSFTGPVNVRSGPSTAYSIIGAGNPGTILNVTGSNTGASWWQVDFNGQQGWVSNRIVQVVTQGNCATVPIATAPPPPPLPTFTPTSAVSVTPTGSVTVSPTGSVTPTWTWTPNGSETPTWTPTWTVTATPTDTATWTPTWTPTP